MTPFDALRQHVRDTPDAVAVSTPYRVASYRKMWSRIERSTARLQGEWAIRPGDTIAYYGCGHLDALVMYLAAARCGARVLPLEHAHLQEDAAALVAAHHVTLILHDDALDIASGAFPVACRPLSTLIATVCRYPDRAVEDSACVSLLQFPDAPRAAGGASAALPQERSLDALAAIARTCPAAPRSVRGALFDATVFAPVILATMLVGKVLILDACLQDIAADG